MKTIKTSELIGPALDWAVAKCEGEEYQAQTEYDGIGGEHPPHRYSTDWSQGGPIIEREIFYLTFEPGKSMSDGVWRAMNRFDLAVKITITRGPTPLIAAMRCFVASRMGNKIDIPEELL